MSVTLIQEVYVMRYQDQWSGTYSQYCICGKVDHSLWLPNNTFCYHFFLLMLVPRRLSLKSDILGKIYCCINFCNLNISNILWYKWHVSAVFYWSFSNENVSLKTKKYKFNVSFDIFYSMSCNKLLCLSLAVPYKL